MKIKEIRRTAYVAWSPKHLSSVYLACGTSAQQLDASFSTTAILEILNVDFSDSSHEMQVAGSIETSRRFHKVIWNDHEVNTGIRPNGCVIAGTDNGEILVFDPAAILDGESDKALLHTLKNHTGPVEALDTNSFQNNIFASGSSNSELLIWDLRNPGNGLVPGPISNPPDQITCVKWNKQVQHILAASSRASRVVVWDLRKSEPIIKVGDQSAMFNYKSIAWHPSVATQMVIGNEDDRYPIIQMWDLRYATSPMKIFEGHTRGVTSLDWCPQDEDLLMSCGKDNRVLCWNPNIEGQGSEPIYELPASSQWTSDIQWCPRHPGLVAASSFDGHVTINTLMGGQQQIQEQQQSQISDSFGIQKDTFQTNAVQTQTQTVEQLKKTPKWLKVPCGARFAFGGKLVSFTNNVNTPRQVNISQVVTEREFLSRSHELEQSLSSGSLTDFCDAKISSTHDEHDKLLWKFLKSNFHNEPRIQFLNLLGYNPQDLAQKISKATSGQPNESMSGGVSAVELASKMEKLKAEAEESETPPKKGLFGSGFDSPFEGAKTPSSDSGAADVFDSIAAQSSMQPDEPQTVEEEEVKEPITIATSDDVDGLVCQALLTGNFEAAVDMCFSENRMADGLLLAVAGGPDLFARTQKRYLEQAQSAVSKVISAVVNGDWKSIIQHSVIENWKEALCTLVTYSRAEEFSQLCCLLGARLENEIQDYNSALICYICAGDVERMVACWSLSVTENENSPEQLQNIMEKVMILKKSVESSEINQESSVYMSEKLCNYAHLLVSQGDLQTAMMYLNSVNDKGVAVMKDRVFQAHGNLPGQPPEFPFERVNMQPVQHGYISKNDHKRMGSYGKSIPNQFSPVASQPNNFFNPASNQTPFNPSTNQTPFNPATNQTPFNPAANQAPYMPQSTPQHQYYQPANPYNAQTATFSQQNMTNTVHSASRPPFTSDAQNMNNQFQPPPPNINRPQLTPGPSNLYNTPQNPVPISSQQHSPSSANPRTSQPNIYTPPPTGMSNGFMQPEQPKMMQPSFNKQEPIGPPPPTGGHPQSMRSSKQESPNQSFAPTGTMNFYNPATAPSSQNSVPGMNPNMPPGMNANMPPGMNPNMPPGINPNMQPGMNPNMQSAAPTLIPKGSTLPPTPQAAIAPSQKKSPVETAVPKGPIPSEHMILQETFDSIVQKCRQSSKNPQAKRKLDDVGKKLEVLYDMLRSNKVSPTVLNGLHQISKACQGSDYMGGIQIHTHMITTGNFSEISSFMPGLKSLMQIAGQLRV